VAIHGVGSQGLTPHVEELAQREVALGGRLDVEEPRRVVRMQPVEAVRIAPDADVGRHRHVRPIDSDLQPGMDVVGEVLTGIAGNAAHDGGAAGDRGCAARLLREERHDGNHQDRRAGHACDGNRQESTRSGRG
jgi:hypothetical protein